MWKGITHINFIKTSFFVLTGAFGLEMNAQQLSLDRTMQAVDALNQQQASFERKHEVSPFNKSKVLRDYNLVYEPPQALFCKIEDAIHQKSKWLCKFRIGDVDYVDRLEGKYIPTVLPSDNPFLYAHSTKNYKRKKKKSVD